METTKTDIPTFESLPAFIAGLARKVEAIDTKLDQLISSPKEETDRRTILTIAEAADFIGKTIGTIYSLTSKRAIPFNKRGNKLYFFKDELIEWIKNGGKADIDFPEESVDNAAFNRHLDRLREGKKRRPRGM